MSATLEWKQGVIRMGSTHEKFGDPYDSCVEIIRDGDVAILYAAAGKLDLKLFNVIKNLLRQEGFKHVRWERYKDGKVHNVEFDL